MMPCPSITWTQEFSHFLGGIKGQIDRTVAGLPSHQSYVERYCAAPK
jgi:tryptophan 7-halogenase